MSTALDKIPTDHKKRAITGLTLFAALVLAITLGSWPLAILIGLTSTLALWEFYGMFWPGLNTLPKRIFGLTLGLGLVLCSMLDKPWLMLMLLSGTFLLASLNFLFRFGSQFGSHGDVTRPEPFYVLCLGLLYIPLSLQLALHMNWREQILVVAAPLVSDIGGYYLGSMWGKRKIWPSISPKKTWMGSLGGLILCILVVCSLCLLLATGNEGGSTLSHLPKYAVLGLLLGVAAQLGDFFESALKRAVGVKDSGKLLPGHGGLLDRIDSLLFTLPILAVYNYFLPIL